MASDLRGREWTPRRWEQAGRAEGANLWPGRGCDCVNPDRQSSVLIVGAGGVAQRPSGVPRGRVPSTQPGNLFPLPWSSRIWGNSPPQDLSPPSHLFFHLDPHLSQGACRSANYKLPAQCRENPPL